MAGFWNSVFLMCALLLYVAIQDVNGHPHNIGGDETSGEGKCDCSGKGHLNIKGLLKVLNIIKGELNAITGILSSNTKKWPIKLGAKLAPLLVKVEALISCLEYATTSTLLEKQKEILLLIQEELLSPLLACSHNLYVLVNTADCLSSHALESLDAVFESICGKLSALGGLLSDLTGHISKLTASLKTILGSAVDTVTNSIDGVLGSALSILEDLSEKLEETRCFIITDLKKLLRLDNAVVDIVGEVSQILQCLSLAPLVTGSLKSLGGVLGGVKSAFTVLNSHLGCLTGFLEGGSKLGDVLGGPLCIVFSLVDDVMDTVTGVADGVLGIVASINEHLGCLSETLGELLDLPGKLGDLTNLASDLTGGLGGLTKPLHLLGS